MKKILCFIVAICLIQLINPINAFSTYSIDFDAFSSQVCDIISTYQFIGIDSTGNDNADITNRLIIKTTTNEAINNDCGAVAKAEGYDNLHILQFLSSDDADNAKNYYSNLSYVEYVEEDYYIYSPEQFNDIQLINIGDYTHLSWGSDHVEANKGIHKVDSLDTPPQITVAVIDTGLDSTHLFFRNRFIDSEYNSVDNSSNTYDDNGHGTHVAGIIVDNTPSNVLVSPYKVLNAEGQGTYLNTCLAIEKAISDKVDVINLSLGADDRTPIVVDRYSEVIEKANNNGIVVVAAAGNNSIDAGKHVPASVQGVITVAASNEDDEPATDYSNYGNCVDIAAPGTDIISTLPHGYYARNTGTSMAAPFVTAASAIIKSIFTNETPEQIKNRIISTAYIPVNWDTLYGSGIVNFKNMLSQSINKIARPSISIITNGKYSISGPSNADIYYTTDGSTPTENSTKYIAPFTPPSGCKAIKAIAVSENLKSDITTYMLQVVKNIEINYKKTVKLDIPKDASVRSIFSDNTEIVSIADPMKPTVYGEKRGNATVTVNFDGGRVYIYNITVKFSFWQWIQYIFLFGFIWM